MKIARITNRAAAVALAPSFEIPKDGKFHLARKGEFPGTVETAEGETFNVIQVLDDQAFAGMANRFAREKAAGAPDLLVDRDHLSSDPENETIAEGWIHNVEATGDDLYTGIRLSAQGEADIKGGNYRFISGVWDVTPIGQDKFTEGCRVRPYRLSEAGLTNRPQITGLAAIANREKPLARVVEPAVARITKSPVDQARAIRNRALQLMDGPRSGQAFRRAFLAAKNEYPAHPISGGSLANRSGDSQQAQEAELLDAEEAKWKAKFQHGDKDCGPTPLIVQSEDAPRKIFLGAVQKYVAQGMPFRAAWDEAKSNNPNAYFHFADGRSQ